MTARYGDDEGICCYCDHPLEKHYGHCTEVIHGEQCRCTEVGDI